MPNKPKTNYSAETMPEKDRCQTPAYAIDPLLPYLKNPMTIWEPAVGEGFLHKALWSQTAVTVHGSDILEGYDFFDIDLLKGNPHGVIVTNPPFSLKEKWLARCYELGYPFALLMPSDSLFAAGMNKQFQQYGIEVIIMNPRVDFHMPNLGWSGSGAQMSTSWFTWGLSIGQMITFADISQAKKQWKEQMRAAGKG